MIKYRSKAQMCMQCNRIASQQNTEAVCIRDKVYNADVCWNILTDQGQTTDSELKECPKCKSTKIVKSFNQYKCWSCNDTF